jgi:D-glycero-alpha-D-manno-heptose-7-phosphate kinase
LSEGGAVLSSAIDKYIFVTVKSRFDKMIRVGYTSTEMVDRICQIKHELIREALIKTQINDSVEITTMGDIPSEGSGLGSSSTVTVGVLHALYTYKGEIVPAEQLAKEACEIEIDILGSPIGKQDQYITAYGGFRFIEFHKDGTIHSEKIKIDNEAFRRLNQNFLLYFTGISRKANHILKEQNQNIDNRLEILRDLKKIAFTAKNEIESSNFDALGELMHKSWQLKKQLAGPISNEVIDKIYNAAHKAGAIGGKITGAGGGGFFLVYCPIEKQEPVRSVLSSLQELPFQLERDGSKVIFNNRR